MRGGGVRDHRQHLGPVQLIHADPGAGSPPPGLPSPQSLYADWERSHWSPFDIDLSRDREDWQRMDDLHRAVLTFAMASLMVAEERISTQFCGLVLAQDDEEEGSFLASQLVDEVRHMQFYARFQGEVVHDPGLIAAHVERARSLLQEPFREIFDGALVDAHLRLCRNPRDRRAKVAFVTIYHLVLEGTLGVTTSHFLLGFLRTGKLLPGFVEGYTRIAADEGRHIAYGMSFLRRALTEEPALAGVVTDQLRALAPAVDAALAPAGAEQALGLTPGTLRDHGRRTARHRLVLVGAPHADPWESDLGPS
ncbi:MAG: ribonucleotide-diphosphate reductase subunit beta [Candidatus Dormibacteria bacterium]